MGDATPGQVGSITEGISVTGYRGATLAMSKNLLQPGLTIDDPKHQSPTISTEGLAPDLSGTVAEQVLSVVEGVINPAVASHVGFVEK